MLNQLRFERNDFRKYVVRFYNVITEKNNIIYVLHKSKLIIEQTNNIARNYQKRITKLQRKINIIELQSLKKDSKNDYFNEPLRSRSDLIQIIKKDKFIKQSNFSIFINNKEPLWEN